MTFEMSALAEFCLVTSLFVGAMFVRPEVALVILFAWILIRMRTV